MKKVKKMGFIAIACALMCGCSCSKVDDRTYSDAVSVYKSTDAISFSRIETISVLNQSTYTRKKIDAKFIFDANKNVVNMEYVLGVSEVGSGASSVGETVKYYYSGARSTLYSYSQKREQAEKRYKESGVSYEEKFNVNVCQDLDCSLLIPGYLAPIFSLDEIVDFSIEANGNSADVNFKAICPSFEHCASSSQLIEYNVTVNEDGNIGAIAYEIENGDTTYSIKYAFNAYGSNNVSVNLPSDLENYIEK